MYECSNYFYFQGKSLSNSPDTTRIFYFFAIFRDETLYLTTNK